eukprot:TRINITY_DN27996_c0_g1_i1.p1 TRINITY_DN27996_c0_g1~~TRINITY_DN27996_c0_g1_i1.p1  ORF type:complete len:559 (+),score=85.23 TRINITY_DN27996_c0_g1_i1:154-1830(+)
MLHALETIQTVFGASDALETIQSAATRLGNACCIEQDGLGVKDVKDIDIDDAKPFFGVVEPLCLPPGKKMTVMMFGMTGAGKSALGNLMAGYNFFTSGLDTASVTNKQSVKRYEAADESLVVLDTIGLGDTKLDQEKVVNSICESALSAPSGVDAVFFVLRNGRITDDMIARIIYVTQYLWGSECLLNLYVVITHAAKYVRDRKDGEAWIHRQNEINWRFRHIYSLVGNNCNRIIFVDNPDPEDGEPFAAVRVAASRRNIFRALLNHPREVIPPFTHQMMIKARELTEKTWHEVQRAEERVQQLQENAACHAPGFGDESRNAAYANGKQSEQQGGHLNQPDLPAQLRQAREQKREAEKAWQNDLERVKGTEEFHQAAVEIVMEANKSFETGCDASSLSAGVVADPVADTHAAPSERSARAATKADSTFEAMKRMLMSMSRVVRPKPRPKKTAAAAKSKVETRDDIERAIDELSLALVKGIQDDPLQLFRKLDAEDTGLLSPITFNNFVIEVVHSPSRIQLAGLWRRADANMDGFLDQSEFCQLLTPPSANGTLQHRFY